MDLCPGVTFKFACRSLVTPFGFEPKTYCLEGSCSIQLSYGAKRNPGNVVSKKRALCGGLSWNRTKLNQLEVTNMVARNFFL